MATDVELRKIAQQLDQLNKNLFHITRTLKEIATTLKYDDSKIGVDQIPKMVNDLATVVEEHAPKTMGSFEQMKAALEENARHKRYQEPKE